ncbi:MAG: S-layer homology domain-containing protein, partial [Clostridia bacterium]|nr:S-layer homology domain-containing protein [Clostridia bacterium]
ALNLQGDSDDGNAFSDEVIGAWYQQYLSVARQNGVVTGQGANIFGIGSQVSREDFAVMLYRALDKEAESADLTQFTDADSVSDYSRAAVAYLANMGVISGYTDGSFRPKAQISRAEAAKLVYELLNKGVVK